MKLKKLIIDNIASIEHAEIDFDATPLAGERLFLITGETGSGKSTIIDCLCLALYGNTPRLTSAIKNDFTSKREGSDTEDSLKTDDVRQLLRRGAVSASIELTFEDSEGIPYIATWEVRRARYKIEGSIQPVVRTLVTEEGVNPPVNLNKTKEITAFVSQLIGLDMNQFFRTVVLAQGKFSEFLSSGENEKAALLEKMTGTEIYAQVGSKIFEVFREKESVRNNLLEQLHSIILLSDEEKAEINEKMSETSREQETVSKCAEGAKKMSQWLEGKAKNEQDLIVKRKDLADKEALTQDSEFVEKRQLASDWDATIEPRHRLMEIQQAQQQIQKLLNEKPAMQEEYDRLCAALRAAISDLEAKRDQLNKIEDYLRQESSNSEMYKGIKSIKSLVNQRIAEQKNVIKFGLALQQEQERQPKVQAMVDSTLEAQRQQDDIVKQLEAQYQSLDVNSIYTKKDDLTNAKQSLLQLKNANDTIIQTTETLNGFKTNLADEKLILEKAQATLEDKRTIRDQVQAAVERETDIKNLLEQAHKSLHAGEQCPICGNTIKQLLDPKGENVIEELRNQLKQALDNLQQTETDIAASQKAIKQLEQQMAKTHEDLTKKTAARDKQWSACSTALSKCGKQVNAMPDNASVDALINALDKDTEGLNEILQKANNLNNRITAERKKLTELTKAHNDAQLSLNQVSESIKSQREAIGISTRNVESLTNDLDGLFTIADWKEHIADDEGFITGLERKAAEYQDKETKAQQLRETIRGTEPLIPAMEDNKSNIKGLVDNGKTMDTVPAKIDELWRLFENKNIDWNNRLDNEQDKETQAQAALDKYLEEVPAMSIERLSLLNNYRKSEIEVIKDSQKQLADSITHMKGEINMLVQHQEELKNNKPDFPEEDQAKLDDICQTCKAKSEELTTLIVELKTRLSTDEKNRETMGEKKAALDKAEAEYTQWAEFNAMLGDATGNKFRKIAQSFILGELLNAANGYLKYFNDRYTLEANPATLTILVRDQMQGDLTSVNTLSGGECFMVSLALALALSSTTGKMFSVDTLFIDEGFGSLSPNYLDNVMETLNRLYDMGGKRVGIISHVEMLKERITTQIQVYRDPKDNTVSRVNVVS